MNTRTLANVRRGLPSFFLDDFFNLDFLPTYSVAPQVDINREDDKITLDMVLAGTPKENIRVEVDDGCLCIETTKGKDEIKKSYTLPDDIDSEKISAKYENGVLNIVLPKSVKVKNTKLIEIQ